MMWTSPSPGARALGTAALVALASPGRAAPAYPVMAPIGEYLMSDQAAEITFARTAAPPSVSGAATVMVLGLHGYLTAAAGTNGFVCLLQRAWFSGLGDTGFWNPKLRAPICFNPQAARSVMPTYLMRTTWAMTGASQADIFRRTQAAVAAGDIHPPEIGALTYMMSKDGYLGDVPHGPWHPHLMFFMPPMPTVDWGADLPGTQVFGSEAGVDPWTMFYVPVAMWSDGTPDETAARRHSM